MDWELVVVGRDSAGTERLLLLLVVVLAVE